MLGESFYLCPTENESILVAQESLRALVYVTLEEVYKSKKLLHFLRDKICEIKKDLYLCNPNTGSAGVGD
ncbi:hypothetical protein CHRY9390_01040 [Chryseobacterium aquaeductus]|uniref:Uncharacterized protein n=1 Tax=Chryseobacterium aquaeductus TaxID=2675056 RepID=A0A9N8QRJ9_9FLAO|nr:hypothetical protein CHRY9390_00881 [Chryseobacterium potabilaquae]CAA7330372.1 hypothetical protein CHRY9390_01040 [Chryseobacterium potabilaquae]CAD7802120.1 hypothetical protein CHRY9390_00881 [Chryseobacterium aquaeductus]CAD7803175.1 hypothetical protein CHRY9390_01040 [Chryseobacterium aquaeductus]